MWTVVPPEHPSVTSSHLTSLSPFLSLLIFFFKVIAPNAWLKNVVISLSSSTKFVLFPKCYCLSSILFFFLLKKKRLMWYAIGSPSFLPQPMQIDLTPETARTKGLGRLCACFYVLIILYLCTICIYLFKYTHECACTHTPF